MITEYYTETFPSGWTATAVLGIASLSAFIFGGVCTSDPSCAIAMFICGILGCTFTIIMAFDNALSYYNHAKQLTEIDEDRKNGVNIIIFKGKFINTKN
jgi:di/tricarboxylate transporter